MTDQQVTNLQSAIREVVEKIRRFQDRNLGEQNTKASLIEPILEALGWDNRGWRSHFDSLVSIQLRPASLRWTARRVYL
jgi:hypothetical protein